MTATAPLAACSPAPVDCPPRRHGMQRPRPGSQRPSRV